MLLAACGGGDGPPRVEGIVVEVDGNLTETRSFVVVTEDGDRFTFVPRDGLRFTHGAPLSHLREHATFGTEVVVDYEEGDDTLVAVELRDG